MKRIPELGSYSWQQPVESVVNTPPAEPNVGDRYIVGKNPTGDFEDKEDNVVWYYKNKWRFDVPEKGWIAYVKDEDTQREFDGTDWVVSFYESLITQDVHANIAAGAIAIGSTVTEGTNLTEFVQQLLLTTYNPTFVSPSGSLGKTISTTVEAGHIQDLTLTKNFNAGQIRGDLEGGIWDPNKLQNPRAGAVDYYIIDGTNTGSVNNKTISDYQVVAGTQTFSATTHYLEGPQPLNSEGENFGSPLAPGSVSANTSIYGRRRTFWGHSKPITDSDDIRDFQSSALNYSNNSTFTITIPVGATNVVFAYPKTLREVSSVIYIEGMNAEIKDIFEEFEVSVEGANGYTAIPYRVYRYIPVEPFSQEVNYEVTI